ncbi:LacI family DNA-binding transcriptional regulator [Paraburkholderia sp. Ac-20342]|uniref:LacI family DNA-binding transcriptional regulator n=1 Tax=Paraburkholderia sp. Ac-20342 TaxID=2703889 RepID=UPI00197EAF1C|nr:LacI family DNA-binding transcriptional regulator [Paraburkholderia sp. Ac-20342]MBN3849572.1 LacI family DNA-binding transcriptional regulator [Paraburkholderia sp. Ac-20342]
MVKAKTTTEDTSHGKKARSSGVTLRDVARFAGVSSATVSRMMNTPEIVSDELRARITAAINHLGWVPHAAARALATQRTGTIGAVFPTVSNEHFATAIQELQDALEAAGYTLLLGCSQYDIHREYNQVRNMLERGIDAIVLVGESHHPDLYPLLSQRQVPFVNSFTFRSDSENPCVGIDNHKAFFNFTTYLLGLGHRRFAMLSQTADSNDRALARREGVRDALAEHGLGIIAAHMVEGFWGVRVGRDLFSKVMSTPQPPSVIICGNGSFAIGAMLEAMQHGYEIPKNLSIVSFDDFEIMSELPIPITTVGVPSAEIGRTAAKMILTELSGNEHATSIECEAQIIIRASSGPPPRTRNTR